MNTYTPKLHEQRQKSWYVVDADGKTLGRLATQVAVILRGKNKPSFTPHLDMGDYVIIVNAEKIRLTGQKMSQKNYFRHTGYPGGGKLTPAWRMLEKHPERVITFAVKGMLPKNSLGRKLMKKLRVFVGPNHNHQAQKPEVLEI